MPFFSPFLLSFVVVAAAAAAVVAAVVAVLVRWIFVTAKWEIAQVWPGITAKPIQVLRFGGCDAVDGF